MREEVIEAGEAPEVELLLLIGLRACGRRRSGWAAPPLSLASCMERKR
jgi:hypothetical protein